MRSPLSTRALWADEWVGHSPTASARVRFTSSLVISARPRFCPASQCAIMSPDSMARSASARRSGDGVPASSSSFRQCVRQSACAPLRNRQPLPLQLFVLTQLRHDLLRGIPLRCRHQLAPPPLGLPQPAALTPQVDRTRGGRTGRLRTSSSLTARPHAASVAQAGPALTSVTLLFAAGPRSTR